MKKINNSILDDNQRNSLTFANREPLEFSEKETKRG